MRKEFFQMNTMNRSEFMRGMRHGWPIGVGYFAVSFALGIAARNAGFTALQASVMSAACTASAGEFGGVTVAAAGGTFLEMALMELVVNARYLLMSCALTQKLEPKLGTLHRMILANFVTDEIFGLSAAVPGKLNPFYTYGIISVSWPGWIIGTCLGVIMGNVLPANVVSALSVGLYGMFLAIIIPPMKKDRAVALCVAGGFALSWLFNTLPALAAVSAGTRTILLTVAIASAAALLFPVKEGEEDA
jgi:predicted branched-subunit amino acid permease